MFVCVLVLVCVSMYACLCACACVFVCVCEGGWGASAGGRKTSKGHLFLKRYKGTKQGAPPPPSTLRLAQAISDFGGVLDNQWLVGYQLF